MKALFTKSDTPLSRAIRGVTGEGVSHCALEVDGWIIHVNLLGLQIESPESFSSHSSVVYSVEIPFEITNLMKALAKSGKMGYDYGALLYLGLRYLLPCLPKKNLWQVSNLYLCTEWLEDLLDEKIDSMLTPYQLYLKLKEKYK